MNTDNGLKTLFVSFQQNKITHNEFSKELIKYLNNNLFKNSDKLSKKSFSISKIGYKPEEVDLFIDQLQKDYQLFREIITESVKQFEKLNAEIINLNNKIEATKKQSVEMKKKYQSLNLSSTPNLQLLKRISNIEQQLHQAGILDFGNNK